ncbi:hypothetical protein RJ640_027901 [Escallonia rubra]|uniref:Reverse transcriptase Ty1/copia-type domain-containing protein n=1 Tax=Escallonia rubra TaxID=112253 RepID=A0AA88U8H3_9ASTE|nr:hypothetical protein RJ640_027901 [Escallonia rubra]
MDDLIYTGNSETMIHEFKEDMMKTFEMSDLGLMHYFLGIGISQEKEDSDWAGSVDDMKSTSGYTFIMGSGIFSWASKKQDTMVQSSSEVEYVAGALNDHENASIEFVANKCKRNWFCLSILVQEQSVTTELR